MAEVLTKETAVDAGRERWVDAGTVLALARKEIRDSLRNRWFLLYTVAFTLLALGLSSLSMVGTGSLGLAGFGKTAAGLINLVILIVPLMALTAGAGSIAAERERGSLGYLLAQPVTRFEVLLGKYLGLAAALLGSLGVGFGVTAGAIAMGSNAGDAASFLRLVGLAFALALAMLSAGFLISAVASRASVASGAAIFLWLGLVVLGDLGLMGGAVAFRLDVPTVFRLSLLNPLQVFKMAGLDSLDASLDVLGPAGLYAVRTYGGALPAIFLSVLAAWTVLPLGLAYAIFLKRGAS